MQQSTPSHECMRKTRYDARTAGRQEQHKGWVGTMRWPTLSPSLGESEHNPYASTCARLVMERTVRAAVYYIYVISTSALWLSQPHAEKKAGTKFSAELRRLFSRRVRRHARSIHMRNITFPLSRKPLDTAIIRWDETAAVACTHSKEHSWGPGQNTPTEHATRVDKLTQDAQKHQHNCAVNSSSSTPTRGTNIHEHTCPFWKTSREPKHAISARTCPDRNSFRTFARTMSCRPSMAMPWN